MLLPHYLRKHITLLFSTLMIPAVLTKLYAVGGVFLSDGWLRAVLWHSLFAVVIIVRKPFFFQYAPGKAAYVPSVALILGTLLVSLASRSLSSYSMPIPSMGLKDIAWVVWVPFVEEVVFRAGIGHVMGRVMPGVWGWWYSSAVFALAHTQVTWDSLIQGQVGIPMGPFLLGLVCQAMLSNVRSIWPCVAFHMAGNGTAFIFKLIDPRWLAWLGVFYV